MLSPFRRPWSEEIAHRCTARYLAPLVTDAATALGEAMDVGLITLDQAQDLVHSCSTADELGDALAMLAATVPVELEPVGCYLLALPAEIKVAGGAQ